MSFAFRMPWRKKGEYSGKRKLQRARYSFPVRCHLAPEQHRVVQRSPCFTTGEEASSLCPTMGCSAAPRAPQPSRGGSCLRCRAPTAVLQIGGDPAPSRCSAPGAGARGRRDGCEGKDASCRHWGCLLISYHYLTSKAQCPEHHFSVLQQQLQQEWDVWIISNCITCWYHWCVLLYFAEGNIEGLPSCFRICWGKKGEPSFPFWILLNELSLHRRNCNSCKRAFSSVICEEGWRTARSRCVSGQGASCTQKGCCVCCGCKRITWVKQKNDCRKSI